MGLTHAKQNEDVVISKSYSLWPRLEDPGTRQTPLTVRFENSSLNTISPVGESR